jgi:Glycosyl transferase family 2
MSFGRAVFLPSVEIRQKLIRLGASQVGISYPQSLDQWFDGLTEARDRGANARICVRLCAQQDGRFTVIPISTTASELDLGDALATFWERVSFNLLNDLSDALALHAAALEKENCIVLLTGGTGAGKTRLALWYRLHGFKVATDEIITVSFNQVGTNEIVIDGVLTRPLMLKRLTDAGPLLRPNEIPVAQIHSSCGLMLRLEDSAPLSQRPIDHGLVVFPSFVPDASLSITALTAGETALRLIGNCLNARNLPRGGLSFAHRLACQLPAVALVYGATDQLDGTLDVLTRQLLTARPTAKDLGALCDAFSARATTRNRGTAASLAPPQETLDAPKRVIPAPTLARFPRRLSVGMATYDDYDGVYFTIQSLRLNNPQLAGDVEFIVIDNNPDGPCSEALSELGNWIDGYRYVPRGEWSGTAIKNAVFEEASSPFVLCVDSHVILVPGALKTLIDYFEANPTSRDLIQGPMLHDDIRKIATHMEPKWSGGMYGVWAEDPRGADVEAPAFDIPMHGMGLFACRRTAWGGFNGKFRGFGGEEGYIHEKMRRRGGRTLCLPFLRWLHRFSRPLGLPYVNRWDDRIRNYLIGFTDLGLDTAEMEAHFMELLGAETSARILTRVKRELGL